MSKTVLLRSRRDPFGCGGHQRQAAALRASNPDTEDNAMLVSIDALGKN